MTSLRLPVSFALSLCATATLFWFLGVLIAIAPRGEPIAVIRDVWVRRFVPEPVEPPPVRPKPMPPKPSPKNELPAIAIDPKTTLPIDHESGLIPLDDGLRHGDGIAGPRGDGKGLAELGGADRAPMPEVRIEPDYPAQARAQHIEGWITFRFTVTASGRVQDVVIVAADPARVFDNATIRAVSTWKYQPALADGKPVARTGLTATYRFQLSR